MRPEAGSPRERIALASERLRGEARIFTQLDSTNTALRDLASRGAPEGTVLVADEQTAGRGRHGRAWSSPAGAGFYGSILLRPELAPRDLQLLTFLAAVAVAETLAGLGVGAVEIKWPNDVLVRGRKICGILNEASFLGGTIEWAIVGIGVNLRPEAIPPDPMLKATALESEGIRITNVELLTPLVAALDRHYVTFLTHGPEPLVARWLELAPMARGRDVTVDDGMSVYDAVTDGVTSDGRLRVRRAGGEVVELAAADVSLGSRLTSGAS